MPVAETETRRLSGSEKRQRTERSFTRLTPDEKAEIDEAANRAGLTVGSFSRAAQLTAARGGPLGGAPVRSVRRPPVEKELLGQAVAQLHKVGSNLNQIARAANMGEALSLDLEATLRAVQEAADAVMQAIGRPA